MPPTGTILPLHAPDGFWDRPDVIAALGAHDIGAIYRLLRQHAGLSQQRIGTAVDMPQSEVSRISRVGANGRQVTSNAVLTRIADGLSMPDHARVALGVAPLDHTAATAAAPSPGKAWRIADVNRLRTAMIEQGRSTDDIATEIRILTRCSPLAAYRMAHGWSQPHAVEQYQQKIGHGYLDQPTLSRLERFPLPSDPRGPQATQLVGLAQLYGTTPLRLIPPNALDKLDPAERAVILQLADNAPARAEQPALPQSRAATRPSRRRPAADQRTHAPDVSVVIARPVDEGAHAGESWRHLKSVVEQAKALWRADCDASGTAARTDAPMTGAQAVLPVFEWENPPADMDVSRRTGRLIGQSELAQVIAARTHYEQMYRRVGGVPVRPRLVNQLTTQITPMLDGRYDDATGRLLFRAVGALVAFAGICSYDAEQQTQAVAQRYFFDALRMAKASGDKAFGGYVVALLTNQAIHLDDFRLAIQYAETALRAGRGFLSPALRTDLHAMQAKSYARIGDRAGCHEQLRLAEAATAQVIVENEPAETGYVQPENTMIKHAEALLKLGDTSAAKSYAQEAVNSDDLFSTRARIYGMATLSMTLAARKEVDESAARAHLALDEATGVESWRLRERLRAMVNALAPYSDTDAVQELVHRADGALSLPL